MPAQARDGFTIRPIEPRDDPAVARLIRSVMPEFGACGEGFAIMDPEVDAMSLAYAGDRARYWVVERDGRIVGGGGFAALEGGDAGTCELRKMYFLAEARGRGIGAELLALCLEAAKTCGFGSTYLETLENMHDARRLYEKSGFQKLEGPRGATGHYGCNSWYLREL
jgi:putative acetyltransferase